MNEGKGAITVVTPEFQFPSNGKAHVNRLATERKGCGERVSIPFKREGTCEPKQALSPSHSWGEFQFPSNGKAHVNTAEQHNSVNET